MSMLFVCLVKLGMLLSLGLVWPGPTQGLSNLKIPPASYLSLALTAGSHSQSLTVRAVSSQVRSKVRGLRCFVPEA